MIIDIKSIFKWTILKERTTKMWNNFKEKLQERKAKRTAKKVAKASAKNAINMMAARMKYTNDEITLKSVINSLRKEAKKLDKMAAELEELIR